MCVCVRERERALKRAEGRKGFFSHFSISISLFFEHLPTIASTMVRNAVENEQ